MKQRTAPMLVGYFDESGTQAGSPAVAVAGALGTAENWARFESRWRSLLRKYSILGFHMTAFETRKYPFDDWVYVRRLACIKLVHSTITWHASAGIAAAVILADYSKVLETSPLRAEVGSPYCLSIKKCLVQSVNWSRSHANGEPVSFVFEAGAKGKGEVQAMFQQAKDDPTWGPFIGTLEFRGKDCLPLQAADVIAYEVWKQMANQRVAGLRRPARKSLYSILAGLEFEDFYFDEENLKELVEKINRKLTTGNND